MVTLKVKYIREAIKAVRENELICPECKGKVHPLKECGDCDGSGRFRHDDCDHCNGHECETCCGDGVVGQVCYECDVELPTPNVIVGPGSVPTDKLEEFIEDVDDDMRVEIRWYVQGSTLRFSFKIAADELDIQSAAA